MFPCTRCGACCTVAAAAGIVERGPSGSCRWLTVEEGEFACARYDDRPPVCRVGYARPPGVPMREYWSLAAEACNMLQAAAGIGPRYRVDIPPWGLDR